MFRIFCLSSLLSLGFLYAAGGDLIRSRAPVTALIYDLRSSNLKALERAYFENEISFFLDYQGVENSVARELYYLREAGKRVSAGDTLGAQNYLRNVHKYVNERTYLQGVIDFLEGRYEAASKTFKALIEKRKSLTNNLRSLAFLGAARVAHEVGDYSQAIFYYSRIQQLDPKFFQAIFEKAWSFYMDGDMNGALGATLTFMTPYAEKVFYPEGPIIRAGAFYHLCLYERANKTIEEMKASYVPIQVQIRELKRRPMSSWLFDEKVLGTVDRRVIAFMIGDGEFRSLQRAYQALLEEKGKLSGSDLAIANQALAFVKRRLEQEGSRVLDKADREVTRALEQADTIQIEILQLGVNVLVGAPIEIRDDIRTLQLGDVDFSELVQFWPFKGEFWFDELGSYYYGLRSACQSS